MCLSLPSQSAAFRIGNDFQVEIERTLGWLLCFNLDILIEDYSFLRFNSHGVSEICLTSTRTGSVVLSLSSGRKSRPGSRVQRWPSSLVHRGPLSSSIQIFSQSMLYCETLGKLFNFFVCLTFFISNLEITVPSS